jgi:indolepyruvate ferredoxin oxidoreductase alpha subunit
MDACVGCGLCGENAHTASLCPSFYRAEIVQNPKPLERLWAALQQRMVRALQSA